MKVLQRDQAGRRVAGQAKRPGGAGPACPLVQHEHSADSQQQGCARGGGRRPACASPNGRCGDGLPGAHRSGCHRGGRHRTKRQPRASQVRRDAPARIVGEHRDRAEGDLDGDQGRRCRGGTARGKRDGPCPPRRNKACGHQDSHDRCAVAVGLLKQSVVVARQAEAPVAQRPAAAAHARLGHPHRVPKGDEQPAGCERHRRKRPKGAPRSHRDRWPRARAVTRRGPPSRRAFPAAPCCGPAPTPARLCRRGRDRSPRGARS